MKLLEPSDRARELRGVMTLRQRRTCTLAWSTNMSHEEIAASQGILLKAVSMRLYQARRRLRNAGIEPPHANALRQGGVAAGGFGECVSRGELQAKKPRIFMRGSRLSISLSIRSFHENSIFVYRGGAFDCRLCFESVIAIAIGGAGGAEEFTRQRRRRPRTRSGGW